MLKEKVKRNILDNRLRRVHEINRSVLRINNSQITKSKILMRRRFGSLKLGFFSDSGFRNPDLIID